MKTAAASVSDRMRRAGNGRGGVYAHRFSRHWLHALRSIRPSRLVKSGKLRRLARVSTTIQSSSQAGGVVSHSDDVARALARGRLAGPSLARCQRSWALHAVPQRALSADVFAPDCARSACICATHRPSTSSRREVLPEPLSRPFAMSAMRIPTSLRSPRADCRPAQGALASMPSSPLGCAR